MKKFLYSLMVVIFCAFSLALTSCGDNDDEPSYGQDEKITINGVVEKVCYASRGEWDSSRDSGVFTLTTYEEHGDMNIVKYYAFLFESNSMPKVGDDFADMDLELNPLSDHDIPAMTYLSYREGSAEVVAINKAESLITIKFSNLRLSGDGYTYTFNGTASVLFDFNVH